MLYLLNIGRAAQIIIQFKIVLLTVEIVWREK